MKKFIYILLTAIIFVACSSDFDANGGLKSKPAPDPTPKDTTKVDPTPKPDPTPTDTLDPHTWQTVIGKALPIDDKMMAEPIIFFCCLNGETDSVKMEPWFLDINTADMTVYRDTYQATVLSGNTPNSERSDDQEFTDKFGNKVTRHHYTQPFKFNNFTHKINGSWNTGYVSYNGKQEAYWPEDGLFYEISSITGNNASDTVHFVRNDSIYAKETVNITYKATLRVTAKNYTWQSWQRTATVTVISFLEMVKHEEEKKEEEKQPEPEPNADDVISNLEWHAEKANRFYNGSAWCDGILFSSSTHWYMLVTTFKLNHDGTKEEPIKIEMYSIAKSVMVTPASGREFNAVMWDEAKNQPIPCRLTVDGNGWGLGSAYADGTRLTKRHDRNESVMSGVKNLSETDNATPSPWIASTWTESTANGKNFLNVTWHTTTHTLTRTIATK